MRRFGPSPMFFVAALAGMALVVAFFATGKAHLGLLVAGIMVLLGTLPGWNWYGLDAAGIHRRGIKGGKFVPWEGVDGVLGKRVRGSRQVTSMLRQYVVDVRGRPLFVLDPWIFHRRRMVRLILATVAARRKDGALRDE